MEIKRLNLSASMLILTNLAVVPVVAMAETTGTLAELPQINVVTAAGREQKIVDAPASITVITREELEKKQFHSLADAVRNVEGVSIVGGNKGSISIRGMESDHVLILVDGRRQNAGQIDLKGGNSEGLEMNWVPPVEAIERIEIVRGPMSTLYGSQAMGGVINIVTRKVADKWTGAVSTDATLQDSSDAGDSYQGDIYLSGPIIPDLLGVQLWGVKKHRDEDEIIDGFNQSRRQGGNVRFTLTPNEDHEFLFEAGRIEQQNLATPGNTVEIGGSRKEFDYIRDSFNLGYTGHWGEAVTDLSFYHEKATREAHHDTVTDPEAIPELRNYVIEGKISLPLGNHMLLSGFQWRKDKLETDGYYASPEGNGIDTSMTEKSLFVEDEWRLTQDFSLTGGLRLDDNEFYGRNWTPRLYGVWHVHPDWTVKGGVAKGFKSPTITEINPNIGLPQRGGAKTWGNPDLKPEKSVNSEIGFYYDGGGKVTSNVTFFHTEFENKIANTGSRQLYFPDGTPVPDDPITGSRYSTYFNITEATIQGVELGVAYQINKEFDLRANYTFTDSVVDSANAKILGFGYPAADGEPLVATPRNMANVTLDWQPNNIISGFAMVNYRGDETQIAWGKGGAVSESVGSVTTLDIGSNWRVTKAFTVSAVAYNLTNNVRDDIDTAYSYAEDGRRFWVKLGYQF